MQNQDVSKQLDARPDLPFPVCFRHTPRSGPISCIYGILLTVKEHPMSGVVTLPKPSQSVSTP